MSQHNSDPPPKQADHTFELSEATQEQTDEIANRLLGAGGPALSEGLAGQADQGGSIAAIAFDRSLATGKVLIRTSNSTYTFFILDSANRSGTLSGGVLGDRHVHATLMDTLDQNNKSSKPIMLMVGGRALFFIEMGRSFRRIVTSRIVELSFDR